MQHIMDITHGYQWLTFIWWVLIGLFVVLYIILDGADLGSGIYSLFNSDSEERGAIMASMAGTWDANETWLVVAGGAIFGTFPLAYGSLFHYLMIPLMVVLWGIIIRAVSLEFHHYSKRSRALWDWGFGIGSLVTTFGAGVCLGAFLQGFQMTTGQVPTFGGGALDFLTPFSILTGFTAVIAASLAGGAYLRARFDRSTEIYAKALKWTDLMFYLALVAIMITVVWTFIQFSWARDKWIGPYWWAYVIAGAIVLFATWSMRKASREQRDITAMIWLASIVFINFATMMATLYPWFVPGTMTIYDAANPSNSLSAFSYAMLGFVPVMLSYNFYQAWVFRARLHKLAGYAH
ncbi:cytochrome d ubiquinol oxidase subunit II [Halothiobacillus neapolitanus]|uniref:Cytochrome d ubiquinol oxidase, subunit II n=1 Tax=Halothiobacillus neapolitanus (strain ATCC 23641 / DSM 15147 / CIP 104769 / NCIMB 8539 / c2) TaxID=555778 RepID=D0L0A7_HALNC|nr:cytochrome d ubiquinol oxidase subunit II [Halothiobacillus neapolitanus]ACX96130.1 cytochrome d ubiquinol oxidase, subunit II [Halothiobacillus neapolitanus c2]TDN66439.1 cytochrome d ubiquinol oxidase subunit II [Halothiobacillus neapolitanus]